MSTWLVTYRDKGDTPPDGRRVVERHRLEIQGRGAVFFDLPSSSTRHRQRMLVIPIDLILEIEDITPPPTPDAPRPTTLGPRREDFPGLGYPSTPKLDHP